MLLNSLLETAAMRFPGFRTIVDARLSFPPSVLDGRWKR